MRPTRRKSCAASIFASGSEVEIALDGAQRSPRYPGGVALRFARVKAYRPDKSPADADTLDSVRDLL